MNTTPNHYMLSPINGEIRGLGQISLFIGTHDLLCPEARRFRDLAEEAMAQMIAILTAN